MVSPCATGNCVTRSRRRRIAHWLAAVATVASFDSSAVEVPLYDASLGVLPSDQSWGWTFCCFGGVTGMVSGATYIDTTLFASIQSGYSFGGSFGPALTLDSAAGFTLSFSLQIISESHNNSDRAGFSIIVLDSAARGVELGFWTNEVWAQNTAFTHGESFSTNTQASALTYDLAFSGNRYTLSIEGTPRLTNDLRAYTGPAEVYAQTNFIFIGDDTTSALARAELSSITLAPVPEPAEWILMLAGLGCVVAVARRQRGGRTGRVTLSQDV